MEIEELSQRLVPFCQEKYQGSAAVVDVWKMPGHAGFAYGFEVRHPGGIDRWFLRLPPPGVKWRGTADVLRQAAVLDALDGTEVPHCSVQWSGDDLEWFGCPYFVVPVLEGDVLRLEDDGWARRLDRDTRFDMARQAMNALAGIHTLDPGAAPYLGDAVAFEDDVMRWDRFVSKAADPERLALQPSVRERLLAQLPEGAPIGIFHGDFQWANLFYSEQGRLLAVIDWELTGIGATLNDVGWIATFNDPEAWHETRRPGGHMPDADQLVSMYEQAWEHSAPRADPLPDLAWFRALAAYKFAIITGFNLMLHRRGKRHDPEWEITRNSIEPLLARAAELLDD